MFRKPYMELTRQGRSKRRKSAMSAQDTTTNISVGVDGFASLDEKITKSSYFKKQLTRIVMAAGGRNVKAFAANVLHKIMTNDLAETYSLTGKPLANGTAKTCFEKSATYKFICEICVRTFKDAKEPEIRKAMSDWFMQAKFRRSRRESRLQKHNAAEVATKH